MENLTTLQFISYILVLNTVLAIFYSAKYTFNFLRLRVLNGVYKITKERTKTNPIPLDDEDILYLLKLNILTYCLKTFVYVTPVNLIIVFLFDFSLGLI
jgi:hypothetical protein